jgi:hypothetical protein
MGYVNFSMPKEIVLKFKEKAGIKNFVETGTFRVNSCFWAAGHFEKVYTIEIDPNISRETASRPDCPKNIEFLIGNSKDVLPGVIEKLKGRSLFWLDGHWCNVSDLGKDMECPLMDELKAAQHLKDAVILIDDARAFLGPMLPPHDNTQWPRIDEIFLLLKKQFPDNFITVADDVIYSIPPDMIEIFDKDWITQFKKRFDQPGFIKRLLYKLAEKAG